MGKNALYHIFFSDFSYHPPIHFEFTDNLLSPPILPHVKPPTLGGLNYD